MGPVIGCDCASRRSLMVAAIHFLQLRVRTADGLARLRGSTVSFPAELSPPEAALGCLSGCRTLSGARSSCGYRPGSSSADLLRCVAVVLCAVGEAAGVNQFV